MSTDKSAADDGGDWRDADSLDEVRRRIDAIDREIHRLLNERAACVIKVAEIKQAEPGDDPPVFFRPEREAQILSRGTKFIFPLPKIEVVARA